MKNAGTKATKRAKGLSDNEVAAMKERITELNAGKEDGERAVFAAIAKMPEPWRSMGKRLHVIIRANAPGLVPRTWYGMPAYSKGGDVLCFFRGGDKFKERYMTLGFNDNASLDDGNIWPIVFALTKLTSAEEARIAALVKKATGSK